MIQQRTPEWYEERAGRFTASTFGDIMTNPADKTQKVSKTALKIIKNAALESKIKSNSNKEELPIKLARLNSFFSDDIYWKPKPIQWGIEYEDAALKLLRETTKWDIRNGSFFVHDKWNEIGATPDALVVMDEECAATIQIKCPYSQSIHQKYRSKITDGASLKKVARKYYWQVLGEMWVMDVPEAWFVSYDPRACPDQQLHIVNVLLSNEDLALLENRLINAIQLRDNWFNV